MLNSDASPLLCSIICYQTLFFHTYVFKEVSIFPKRYCKSPFKLSKLESDCPKSLTDHNIAALWQTETYIASIEISETPKKQTTKFRNFSNFRIGFILWKYPQINSTSLISDVFFLTRVHKTKCFFSNKIKLALKKEKSYLFSIFIN